MDCFLPRRYVSELSKGNLSESAVLVKDDEPIGSNECSRQLFSSGALLNEMVMAETSLCAAACCRTDAKRNSY
jgi:hypothetical protein